MFIQFQVTYDYGSQTYSLAASEVPCWAVCVSRLAESLDVATRCFLCATFHKTFSRLLFCDDHRSRELHRIPITAHDARRFGWCGLDDPAAETTDDGSVDLADS